MEKIPTFLGLASFPQIGYWHLDVLLFFWYLFETTSLVLWFSDCLFFSLDIRPITIIEIWLCLLCLSPGFTFKCILTFYVLFSLILACIAPLTFASDSNFRIRILGLVAYSIKYPFLQIYLHSKLEYNRISSEIVYQIFLVSIFCE